jgi:hypothetical protein
MSLRFDYKYAAPLELGNFDNFKDLELQRCRADGAADRETECRRRDCRAKGGRFFLRAAGSVSASGEKRSPLFLSSYPRRRDRVGNSHGFGFPTAERCHVNGCALSPASCEALWFSVGRVGTGGNPQESNQVQPIAFHRGEAETRRKCDVGEGARERLEVSGGTRRGDSNPRGLANLRDKSGIFGGSRRESNQVQAIAFFFAGAGSETRTTTGTRGDARSVGLVPIRYMQVGRRAEGVKHWVSRECSGFTADLGGFHTCARDGADAKYFEFAAPLCNVKQT